MNPNHYAARFPRILIAAGDEGKAHAEKLAEGLNMPAVDFPSQEALLAALVPGRDALVVIRHESESACRVFLQRIRELDPGVPVVSLSRPADWQAADEADRAGFNGCIAVPISNDSLEGLRSAMSTWRMGFPLGFFVLNDDPSTSNAASDGGGEPERREFRILVATGGDRPQAEMFVMVIHEILDRVPHRIDVAPTRHMNDTVQLLEFRHADFVLIRLNVFEVSKNPGAGGWMPAMEEFINLVRPTTSAALFCAINHWLPMTRERLLRAGADFVHPMPFNLADLKESVTEAHKMWLAEKRT
jgi:CheY-like chemotaxis protein